MIKLKSYPLPSGPRDKFFVVLNVDCGQDIIYHALATSQVERYQNLRFAKDGVMVPQGAVPCFPLATVVDCHTLQPPMRREVLYENFCAHALDIFDPLPKLFINQCDAILRRNRLIAPGIKALILMEETAP